MREFGSRDSTRRLGKGTGRGERSIEGDTAESQQQPMPARGKDLRSSLVDAVQRNRIPPPPPHHHHNPPPPRGGSGHGGEGDDGAGGLRGGKGVRLTRRGGAGQHGVQVGEGGVEDGGGGKRENNEAGGEATKIRGRDGGGRRFEPRTVTGARTGERRRREGGEGGAGGAGRWMGGDLRVFVGGKVGEGDPSWMKRATGLLARSRMSGHGQQLNAASAELACLELSKLNAHNLSKQGRAVLQEASSAIEEHMIRLAPSCTAIQLCGMLKAYAKGQKRPSKRLLSVCDLRVLEIASHFNAMDVSNYIWAFAKLEVRNNTNSWQHAPPP